MKPRPLPGPIYAVADVGVLGPDRVVEAISTMAGEGISWIQLRAKPETGLTDRDLFTLTAACRRRLEGTESKLWIDDRADLAAVVAADGLHVGQSDLPPEACRVVLGPEVWIGLSTHDPEQVRVAEADSAVDVVAIGPVFETTGKRDPDPRVGLAGVEAARRLTTKPLVAIGGIDEDNLRDVLAAGADTVAVLGAVCRGDVRANSARLVAAAGGGA